MAHQNPHLVGIAHPNPLFVLQKSNLIPTLELMFCYSIVEIKNVEIAA